MNYFTADIHFCDELSMRSDNRPFKTIKDYDKFTIKEWNKTAKKGDTIFVIGDLFDCNDENSTLYLDAIKLIKKVKADVVLIIGNNEQRIIKYFFKNDFDFFANFCINNGIKEVYKNLDLEVCGKKCFLVHQIKDGNKKKFNLFGHTHLCSGLYHPFGLCVSCDLNHFRLYSEEILAGYMQRKTDYWEPDENCNYVNPFIKIVNCKEENIRVKKNKAYKEYLDSNK